MAKKQQIVRRITDGDEEFIVVKPDFIENLEAELEKVKRERDAAVRDCARFPCYTCNERENGDFCHQCRTTGTFRALHEWRGPCAENGGAE